MNYKFTSVFVLVILFLNLFHFKFEKFITELTGKKFPIYLIFAVFSALAIIFLFLSLLEKNNNKVALILLSFGLIFFFLLSRPVLTHRINLLEFFILGVVVYIESKKSRSVTPFLIVILIPFFAEIGNTVELGTSFYYLDAWINVLSGLSGYVSMSLFKV